MTVELMTVSNILDCESRCTIKRASDNGTGRLSVSIVCKGVEFCGRQRGGIGENSEHAVTALCRGRRETSSRIVPNQSSASRVCNRGCKPSGDTANRSARVSVSCTGTESSSTVM